MACFFLAGDNSWNAAEEGEHSGDAVLFIAPDGTTMLYDCDTPNNGADIVYALQQLGIDKLDYFVNSHPHIDHMGGFSIIARHIEIGHVYTSDAVSKNDGKNTPYYDKLLGIIEEKGIEHTYVSEGDTFDLTEDVHVKVYNPPKGLKPSEVHYNEFSLVLKITYKDSSFLVGGDSGNRAEFGRKTEELLVTKYGDELQADVSKINHHAEPSTQSSSPGWLASVNSKIYVGTMSTIPNDVEHFKILKKCMETGATYLHTGIDGTVLIYTTGDGTYELRTQKLRVNDYYGDLGLVDGHKKVE